MRDCEVVDEVHARADRRVRGLDGEHVRGAQRALDRRVLRAQHELVRAHVRGDRRVARLEPHVCECNRAREIVQAMREPWEVRLQPGELEGLTYGGGRGEAEVDLDAERGGLVRSRQLVGTCLPRFRLSVLHCREGEGVLTDSARPHSAAERVRQAVRASKCCCCL